jgi:hypothetical protein
MAQQVARDIERQSLSRGAYARNPHHYTKAFYPCFFPIYIFTSVFLHLYNIVSYDHAHTFYELIK